MLRLAAMAACFLLVGTVAGCAIMGVTPPATTMIRAQPVGDGQGITMPELNELTNAFADRLMTLIASACDEVEQTVDTAEQRRAAHQLKLAMTTSVFDIVTNPDPLTQLFDLVLVVTLYSQVWIDENVAEEVFGDSADVLIRALRDARVEIWDLAARAMEPEVEQELDQLIWDWRRDHPDVTFVGFVRFDDFAANRGKSMIAEIRTGGGFLAPVNEATKAVDEARLFAERVFYVSKRAPILLQWYVEALAYELLLNPDVVATMEGYQAIARVTEEIPERITAERKAIFEELDRRMDSMNDVTGNIRRTIADAQGLVDSVNSALAGGERVAAEIQATSEALTQTILAADRLAARYGEQDSHGGESGAGDSGGAGGPGGFDIDTYRLAASELTLTLRELNAVIASTDTLLGSASWTDRLGEINAAAAQRVTQATEGSERVIDRLFQRAVYIVLIFFVLLVAYRGYATWLGRAALTRR